MYEEPPVQDALYEEPPVVRVPQWGRVVRAASLTPASVARCVWLVLLRVGAACGTAIWPCPSPWPGVSPGHGQAKVTETTAFFPVCGQVQPQDAGAEHVDSYPELSGKGLCARALYDYQAGNEPLPPPQATGPQIRGQCRGPQGCRQRWREGTVGGRPAQPFLCASGSCSPT